MGSKDRIRGDLQYRADLSPESFGFSLIEESEITKTYERDIWDDLKLELTQTGNIFDLYYHFRGKRRLVAHRYVCTKRSELEFILRNGRASIDH